MEDVPVTERSETLDPNDWTKFRDFAHRSLDDAIDYTRGIRRQPVWRGVPDCVKGELREKPPEDGQRPESVYEEFRRLVLPYIYANLHPRAWGWVIGSGTAQGIVHQMWTAALNCNVFGAEQSPDYVEEQVLNWFKEKFGFSSECSGLLVSGTSTATLTALAIARTAMLGKHVVSEGLQEEPKRVTLYCSSEAHLSVSKAVALLGMGTNSLRRIGVDEKFRISIPELLACISIDRDNGHTPLCIIGNAGTVNTGATDDLEQLASICEREHLWFHVDGAFGGLLKLSPALSPIVSGLERADSVAFDLHKWMHIPYDAACLLTRHPDYHRASFSSSGAYVERHQRGIATGIPYIDYGMETSRPFRALKIWWALKENGFKKYARMIEQNVEQARLLADLVDREPQLRLLSANLNIVCFQFALAGFAETGVSELNQELLYRLHETGIAVPSYTELNGRYAIRVAITNHRSTTDDIVLLVREVVRIGSNLAAAS
jgi:glutamate/tyrosine decarboxylase-like PLP-dependent enzyme